MVYPRQQKEDKMKKLFVALALLFSLSVPAQAEPPVYWQSRCDGVITWSVQGGRTKIVKQRILILDAAMTHYRFVRVAPGTEANIEITMNAGYNPSVWGLTWLFWQGDSDILNAEVEVYINKGKPLIGSVLFHELLHAVGIPHIEGRPSIMNARGSLNNNGYLTMHPADWQMLRNQDGLCS